MKTAKLKLAEMIRLYEEGWDPEEIRAEYGYKTTDYVIEKLRRAKVYQPHRIDTGKIRALRKAGWSIKSIAEEEYISEEKVREVLNEGK